GMGGRVADAIRARPPVSRGTSTAPATKAASATTASTEMTALCRVLLITPPAAPGPPGVGARPHLLQFQPAARPADRRRSNGPARPVVGPWRGQRHLPTLSAACDDGTTRPVLVPGRRDGDRPLTALNGAQRRRSRG